MLEPTMITVKELVEKKYPLHMGTAYCNKWCETHQNCIGCESEIGCKKANEIVEVMFKGFLLLRMHNDTNWIFNVIHTVAEKIDSIMEKEEHNEHIE